MSTVYLWNCWLTVAYLHRSNDDGRNSVYEGLTMSLAEFPIKHPYETSAETKMSAEASINSNNNIEFNFVIFRPNPERVCFEIPKKDLRTILLQMAESAPEVSVLFADCAVKAIAADALLLKHAEATFPIEVAQERVGKYDGVFRKWYQRICGRYGL
jgi:hypothetical protein